MGVPWVDFSSDETFVNVLFWFDFLVLEKMWSFQLDRGLYAEEIFVSRKLLESS